MKLLPPPGPLRWRAIGLLFAIVVLAAYYVPGVLFPDDPPAAVRPTTPNPIGIPSGQAGASGAASNSKASAAQAKKADQDSPVPVDLAALEPVTEPASPESGRNPFRFGEPPKPPPPVFVPPPQLPPPPPMPPAPPPVPQVKLTLLVTMLGPDGGKWVASFRDDTSKMQFTATEGDVIDGRYRLIKVAEKSAVVSFLDGTGQRTLRVGG